MVVPEAPTKTASTTRHSVASNASSNTVLNHNGGRHLEIAAIESTFMVHEYNRKKRKWVKRARTVFNVIVEDMDDSRSLVRYITDFIEFDKRIKAHYRKCRIPLPPLIEPQLYDQRSSSSRRNNGGITAFLSRLSSLRYTKSNSQKIESYLRRCALHPTVGRSSLLRDFLSAQRNEDKILPLHSILEEIQADHQENQRRMSQEQHYISPDPRDIPDALIPEKQYSSSVIINADDDDDDDRISNMSIMTTPVEQPQEEKICIHDFNLIKVLGGGCMGKVFLVRRPQSCKLLALKAIPKPMVFVHSQIEHAKTERHILTKLGPARHPFLVRLRYAFQDPKFLFLAFDFHAGGDLATQLKLHTRFSPERCRLYAAEILLGLQELHRWGILYRDLKPENILIGADGHIILTDFGLSKWFYDDEEERADTMCGTPEYLAPEILLSEKYSYEVDYWSFGTILYEMIDGYPPFYDDNQEDMYLRILSAPLEFHRPYFDPLSKDLLRGLLQRNPAYRLGSGPDGQRAIRSHRYFAPLDWSNVYEKRYRPSYVPDLKTTADCSHFDPDYVQQSPRLSAQPSVNNSSIITSAFEGYSYINDMESTTESSIMSYSSTSYMSIEEDNPMASSSVSSLAASLSKSLQDSNLTDPHPPALHEQQANSSSCFWYNDSEVVQYDLAPESDIILSSVTTSSSAAAAAASLQPASVFPPARGYYYNGGGASALFSVDEYSEDSGSDYDPDHSSSLRIQQQQQQLKMMPTAGGLSRHYGARQINNVSL
ncbi:kinase-like protein [Lichtheimia hyalospora FSU 10163]|nr:kinase-like protein [Lichtheimia hyalospora FSU 10163]